jgi:U32 family peptidase
VSDGSISAGRRPEILAPAGDRAALEAAVRAGADAVYFGLGNFSARARATNFGEDQLAPTMEHLHRHGVKGYVALNTLIFDGEMAAAARAIRACAGAGVDALIVQDLGVAALARAVAPGLTLHASTQMTCTDAASVELARSAGARRVVLARELSLAEIAQIRACTDVELEVFVHGALCIAYSGQCLTSEAFGGRSANRGACAQACRLPYELLVDGRPRDLGEQAYLLSPQDLEAAHLVPELAALGVSALKIEGRLKSPEYVAATTRLYRAAVDALLASPTETNLRPLRERALQMYSRGSGPGFLAGVDHQRLVDGHTCEHRGLRVGTVRGVRRAGGDQHLLVDLGHALALGDGVVVAGGREGAGEIGGRVWGLAVKGRQQEQAAAGPEVSVWLGPKVKLGEASALRGRALHRTSDPAAEREVRAQVKRGTTVALDLLVSGSEGAPARIEGRSARGHHATVQTDVSLARPQGAPALDGQALRAQLGRLGGTPFHLASVTLEIPPGLGLPPSALNRARRALVQALFNREAPAPLSPQVDPAALLAATHPPDRPPPPAGLFVLCRNLDQARAALTAGADGVYLDILELTGTGDAFRTLRAEGAGFVGLAPPRIRKPGEEKIDRFLHALGPAAILVRGLGALHELAALRAGPAPMPLAVGDFSLNVTNRLAAAAVLGRGLDVFTPAFDLDADQLRGLVAGPFAGFAEVVVHHPMPLFHMEHCLFAALLSKGKDFRDCGRPCERHQLSLRDRAGMEHPVEADIGCRNTVFHTAAQSAAEILPALADRGVRRFRIELVRESAADTRRLVQGYRALIGRQLSPQALWQDLRAGGCGSGYGVVRGSLRVLT